MPPLLADFTHARPCKPFCEKYLTLPDLCHAYANYEMNLDMIKMRKKNEAARSGAASFLYLLFLDMIVSGMLS